MKKVIGVRFSEDGMLSEKMYSYFTDIEDLKPGDWVIVKTRANEFNTAMVVESEGLSRADIAKANKWIVQKINTLAYEARAEKEKVISEIRNQLRSRKEEAEEYLIYEQLAKVDPGIATLLARLHEIDPDSVPKISAS